MQLNWNDEQIAKIASWLNEKWGPNRKCSQCDISDWRIGEIPVSVPAGNSRGRLFDNETYPCIAVICHGCGNVILLSSMIAGIVEEPQEAIACN